QRYVAPLRPAVDQLVGQPRRRRVDEVVEGVDCDLLLWPEQRGRGYLERRQGHLRGSVDRRAVGRACPAWRQTRGGQKSAQRAPGSGVAPVREVVEACLRSRVLELLYAEHLRGRPGRRRARRAAT